MYGPRATGESSAGPMAIRVAGAAVTEVTSGLTTRMTRGTADGVSITGNDNDNDVDSVAVDGVCAVSCTMSTSICKCQKRRHGTIEKKMIHFMCNFKRYSRDAFPKIQ